MNRFVLTIAALLISLSVRAIAQTCIVPAPATPPFPIQLNITLPKDGGTVGCTAYAVVQNGAVPSVYPIGNAKCAVAVTIALQAAANDNGWSDGGVP